LDHSPLALHEFERFADDGHPRPPHFRTPS
jgi:hypothetical protein